MDTMLLPSVHTVQVQVFSPLSMCAIQPSPETQNQTAVHRAVAVWSSLWKNPTLTSTTST